MNRTRYYKVISGHVNTIIYILANRKIIYSYPGDSYSVGEILTDRNIEIWEMLAGFKIEEISKQEAFVEML